MENAIFIGLKKPENGEKCILIIDRPIKDHYETRVAVFQGKDADELYKQLTSQERKI